MRRWFLSRISAPSRAHRRRSSRAFLSPAAAAAASAAAAEALTVAPGDDGSMSATLSPRPNDASTTLLRPAMRSDDSAAPSKSEAERAADEYDEALSLCASHGSVRRAFYLNQLLAVCGGANAADAVEILAVSFILPSASDDLTLSGLQKGWLAGMIFAGMMLGGWAWGALSDRYGRRTCLLWCLVINGIGGLLSAVAPTFLLLLLCRFVSGVGVGGSVPVVFTYFSEFLSTRQRGAYMVGIACCWMVGSLFTAGLAWVIIPRGWSFPLWGMQIHSWRMFTFLCAFPSLACAAGLSFLPESPRWLLSRGRHAEAKRVLVDMYEVNYREEMRTTELAGGIAGAAPAQAVHDEYAEELGRGLGRNSWCGACCQSRRTRHTQARPYIVPLAEAEAVVAPGEVSPPGAVPVIEQAELLGGGSIAAGFGAHSHSGSHGIHYTTIDVPASAASSPTGASALASSSTSAVVPSDSRALISEVRGSAASPSLERSAFLGSRVSDSDAAQNDAFYEECPERRRWGLFVRQLARLDSVPLGLDSPLPPSPSGGGGGDAASDAASWDGTGGAGVSSSAHFGPTPPSRSGSRCHALCSSAGEGLRLLSSKTASLFRPPHRPHTIKLVLTWFFLAFGYYGLTMWMPTYFADSSAEESSAARGGAGVAEDGGGGDAMYVTAVIGALSALPANVVSLWSVRAQGRIRTLVGSLLLSSICVLLVPLLASRGAAEAMLTIFSGVNTAAWNALNVVTTEVYSTEIRATAFGFCAATGRIGAILGNLMFGALNADSQVMPLFFTALALFVAAIASAWLPETKSTNLA